MYTPRTANMPPYEGPEKPEGICILQLFEVTLDEVTTQLSRAEVKEEFDIIADRPLSGERPTFRISPLYFVSFLSQNYCVRTDLQYSGLGRGRCCTPLWRCGPSYHTEHWNGSDIRDTNWGQQTRVKGFSKRCFLSGVKQTVQKCITKPQRFAVVTIRKIDAPFFIAVLSKPIKHEVKNRFFEKDKLQK